MVLGVLLTAFLLRPTVTNAQDLDFSTDIGAVGTAGAGTFNASTGAYQIDGVGVGLAGSADAFHFAYYESVCGDGQMVVRLASADSNAQAALVVRESLDANAASAAASVAGGNAQFVRRLTTGNNAVAGAASSVGAPCWLKVVRSGATISAYVSPDDRTWTSVGTDTVTLANPTIYVGLAVSNGLANATTTARATFDGVQSTFLPSEGLALWLRADAGVTQDAGGRVSSWADQSGHGMDATQPTSGNQPQVVAGARNGQPALHFDGAASYLSLPNVMGAATAGELFVVLRATDPAHRHSFMNFGTSPYGLSIYPYTDGHIYDSFGSTNFYDIGVPPVDLTQFHLYNASSIAGAWTARLNGQVQFATTSNTVGFNSGPTIGYSDGYAGTFFAGDIAELLVFDHALTDAERQTVSAYLNAKYAYAAPPPSPTQLAASTLSATQIALSWSEDPSATVTGYQVERQNADGTWSVVAVLGRGTLSYIDNGVTAGVTYQYRVTALNGYGGSAPSSIASFATDPNVSVGTFPTAGMQLWLRADLGAKTDANGGVSTWTDQAGGGHTASQADAGSRPLLVPNDLNGRPAMRFNGSNSSLGSDFAEVGGQEMTFFVVTKGTTYQSLLRFQPAGSGSYLVYPWSASQIFIDSADYNTSCGVPCGLVANQWNIGSVVHRSNAQVTTYRNGGLVASRATSGSDLPAGLTMNIGAYAGGGEYLAADVAEVLIYGRALSDGERQRVEAYLNGKYAVVAAPGAPTALAGSAISSSQVSLLWQVVTTGGEAAGFAVERRPADGSGGYVEVAAIAGEQIGS